MYLAIGIKNFNVFKTFLELFYIYVLLRFHARYY